MATPARTVFLGSGAFAVPALERLAHSDRVDVVAVVTAPPRPAGRKGQLRATPVQEAATELGIRVLAPGSLRDAETLATLRAINADLMVLADYGRIVPSEVLRMPPQQALNLHPSLLPRHRGAAPIAAAIGAGDTVTGVTLMRMDEGLDTGPIVAQRELALLGDEVAPELEARLAVIGADLLEVSLPGWLDGSLAERPQPTVGVTMTRPLKRRDGQLDPSRPAAELERQVRALQPWPGSFVQTDGERLIVWGAEVVESQPDTPTAAEPAPADEADVPPAARTVPSSRLVPSGDELALVTASGLLRLTEVQSPGKRRMSGADYRRGRRA